MKSFKKVLGLFLACVMALSCMSFPAFADDTLATEGTIANGTIAWSASENVLEVGLATAEVTEITASASLPDYTEGTVPWYDVWCSDSADSSDITELYIDARITHIGDYNFCNNDNLKTVVIIGDVSALKDIGVGAFSNCASLNEIVLCDFGEAEENDAWAGIVQGDVLSRYANIINPLPETLWKIDDKAFEGCSQLEVITVPDTLITVGDNAFFECTRLRDVNTYRTSNSNTYAKYSVQTDALLYGVTTIGTQAFASTAISTFGLPQTLTTLGERAFANTKLTSTIIPAALTEIPAGCYFGCTQLSSVEIPKTVTAIGKDAFGGCDNLIVEYDGTQEQWDAIEIASGNEALNPTDLDTEEVEVATSGTCGEGITWTFDKSSGVLTISGTGEMTDFTESAPWYALRDSITSVVINKGLTHIGDNAFKNCSILNTISVPDTVTSIGRYAFYKCVCLTEFDMPVKLTTIGDSAFYGCTSLKRVVFPSTLNTIGVQAYYGCSGITDINFNSATNLASIGECAFVDCDSVTDILLPYIAVMGAGAFRSCDSLEIVTITDGLRTLPDYAFQDCGKLVSVSLPEGMTRIGEQAFYRCYKLNALVLPSSILSIGTEAFRDCISFVTVTLPSSLTSISEGLFRGCSNMTAVYIPASVSSIGAYAFYGCYGSKGTVAYGGTDAQWNAVAITTTGNSWLLGTASSNVDGSGNAAGVTTSSGNAVYSGTCGTGLTWTFTAGTGVLSISGSGAMSEYTAISSAPWSYHKANITSIVIGSDVTSIGAYAFYGCTALQTVTIPSNVTSISESAFEGCAKMSRVIFADDSKCAAIGSKAFASTGITEITLPSSVTSIGSSAFSNCSSLVRAVLPYGLTSIANDMFSGGTALQYVYIPTTVLVISYDILEGCKDATVYYGGSETQWEYINITSPNSELNSAKKVYNASATTTPGGDADDVPTPAEGYQWTLNTDTGTLVIQGEGPIEDYTLTDTAPWWDSRDYIKSVRITKGITAIGSNAFLNCINLVSVEIADTVTEIKANAFDNCLALKNGVGVYTGTIAQFSEIEIGDGNDALLAASITCSDGKYDASKVPDTDKPEEPDKPGDGDEPEKPDDGDNPIVDPGNTTYDPLFNDTDSYVSGDVPVISVSSSDSSVTAASAAAKFTDVDVGDYFALPVSWAIANNIVKGMNSEGTIFAPAKTCTRAEIITLFYRVYGSPEVTTTNPYTDVSADDYYYAPAVWAYTKNLITGTQFDADSPCTRAAVVMYLWQLAGSPVTTTYKFTDVPTGAYYARACSWAVSEGITNGMDDACTIFAPYSTCTRGQIMTFLCRAYGET